MADNNVVAMVPASRATALEPQSIAEAIDLCRMAVASRMLPKAVQTPEQALMILMRGRELGLTAMQSFASIHVIDGKASMSAELVIAKVKSRRDLCVYFRFVSGDQQSATFETQRAGEPEPTRLTFTMADASTMGLAGKDNWKKQPGTMLRWRCATALARLVYPELTLGIYSTDEAEDIDVAPLASPPAEATRTVAEAARVEPVAPRSFAQRAQPWIDKLETETQTPEHVYQIGREMKDLPIEVKRIIDPVYRRRLVEVTPVPGVDMPAPRVIDAIPVSDEEQ